MTPIAERLTTAPLEKVNTADVQSPIPQIQKTEEEVGEKGFSPPSPLRIPGDFSGEANSGVLYFVGKNDTVFAIPLAPQDTLFSHRKQKETVKFAKKTAKKTLMKFEKRRKERRRIRKKTKERKTRG